MKTIKIFNKEFDIFKLCISVAAGIFILAIIIAFCISAHQKKVQKSNEAALLTAIDSCVNVCDKIFEKMDRTDDKMYVSYKENIENAVNTTDKYYATQALMNYTDEEYNRKFRDNAAREYQKLPPNNYEADKYQKELVALYNEFYDAFEAFKVARGNYTIVKE